MGTIGFEGRFGAGGHWPRLEIGIGSGLNLPLYAPQTVQQVIGLEPSPNFLEMSGRVERYGLSVDFVEGSAEEIP
jgi:hypothetical protein